MTASPSTAGSSSVASPGDLAAAARRSYTGGPILQRKLHHWRPFICPFDRLLPHIPRGASVLDVGCGGGLFLALLAQSEHFEGGGKGVGFDVSRKAIETARRMAEAMPDGSVLEFHAIAPADPWPQCTFEVVSMIDVMHHIAADAQQRAFEQAVERLAPGGVLLYKDMAAHAGLKSLANRLHDLLLARQWISYVPIEQIETWAQRSGLKLTHSEEINRLWYAHELRVFQFPESH